MLSKTKQIQFDTNLAMQLCFTICVIGLILFSSADALANSTSPLSDTLCNVVKEITGKTGKAIATLAIVAMGMGLFVGKLSWGVAAATSVGVGMLFASQSIVGWLAGSAGSAASNCS